VIAIERDCKRLYNKEEREKKSERIERVCVFVKGKEARDCIRKNCVRKIERECRKKFFLCGSE